MNAAYAALASVLLALGPATAAETVRIGAVPSYSSTTDGIRKVAASLNLLSEKTGVEIVFVDTGGSIDNLRRLERGQIDVALVSEHSLASVEDRDGVSLADRIRIICAYSVGPQDVYVRADTGIKTLGELNGVPFVAGGAGTGTERTTMDVFDALGIEPKWVRLALDQFAGAVASGEVVGFVKSGTPGAPDALVTEIGETHPLRPLSLPPGQWRLLHRMLPGIVEWPAGRPEGTGTTWADPMVIVGTDRLSDKAAGLITAALLNTDDPGDGYDRKGATLARGGPIHPGSARALRGQ
jgi:TRAP-type uncharacterized transport system substrate-binding protein